MLIVIVAGSAPAMACARTHAASCTKVDPTDCALRALMDENRDGAATAKRMPATASATIISISVNPRLMRNPPARR